MNKINLLPWREELRIKLNKVFYFGLVKNIVLSVIVVFIVNGYIDNLASVNADDVLFVNNAMQKMSTQVAELETLDRNKKQILERISIIQSLQKDRFSIVKLLDTIPRAVPQGLYLTLLSRKAKAVAVAPTTLAAPGAAGAGSKGGAAAANKGGGGKSGGKGGKGGGDKASPMPSPSTAAVPAGDDTGVTPAAKPAAKPGATPAAKPGAKDAGPMKEKYIITVEGVSDTNTNIAKFLKSLEDVKEFESVKLNNVGMNKNGAGLSFQIEFMQDINE